MLFISTCRTAIIDRAAYFEVFYSTKYHLHSLNQYYHLNIYGGCFHPEWFECSLMQVVRLDDILVLLLIYVVSGLKWMGPVVVNVKRDLLPGSAQCVVSKVSWSVVL